MLDDPNATHHKFVDFQTLDTDATHQESTDRQRPDGQGTDGKSAYREGAYSRGANGKRTRRCRRYRPRAFEPYTLQLHCNSWPEATMTLRMSPRGSLYKAFDQLVAQDEAS